MLQLCVSSRGLATWSSHVVRATYGVRTSRGFNFTTMLPHCRQAADAARQQLQRSAAAEKALEQKLRGLRTTAAGLKAESSSSANQNVVVQALLEAKRKGEIPGVYGRLGDLGSIDAKYVWSYKISAHGCHMLSLP